ncbi:MAG: cell envelope protein SmpA [Alphaproteobacteria bacterium]|nr:MAG: cell envelope protein SmpA [Alphaproteobacteria bacterium]
MQKFLKIIFCCLISTNIIACSPVTAQRGNLLQDSQVSDIVAGQHTRSDVLRVLGSPTTQSTFDANIWYYIGQETEKHGILDDEVVKERIVVVSFTKEGIVESIGDQDAQRINIPYARSKTPTHGNELTFTQQLLGNMGRFNTPKASPTDQ